MRRLVPDHAELELDDAYAGLVLPVPAEADARPYLAVGMVASIDGAVAIDGRSTALGGDADRRAFARLRTATDLILVGAGTVRAEDYGPPRASAARVAARRAAGLAPAPQLVVVSGSAALDPSARLFQAPRDPQVPPAVVVTAAGAPPARIAALEEVAEVVVLGDDHVDLEATLAWCRRHGHRRVLAEGGPTLNGALFAAGLVDEVFLTVAPQLVGGGAGRIVAGPSLPTTRVRLLELHEHDSELLLRYRVEPGRPAAEGGVAALLASERRTPDEEPLP